jgi:hypothetical protein
MRPAAPVAIAAVLFALLAGCGSQSSSMERRGSAPGAPFGARVRGCGGDASGVGLLRAGGVSCAEAKGIAAAWRSERSCAGPPGGPRTSCSVDGYRCLGVRGDRGLAVSCSRPGASIDFRLRRG